ncbi:MAG: SPFH domain-containing protein [Thermoanaerobaculaceae bacterium]|nr:SPFH domain-containing protein [Thermoanaerobaculaceae bacterium]MDI9621067.1 SPFH domain-containing protein [Acidobacteriota bacterium]NLH12499.1 SPFH domain-containing protein [Holophagae bacterium]HPW56546.1 SPFH domain-containing protein [Thermoanaerobaculaceae bacterium]
MSNERVFKPMSGWGMLALNQLLYPGLAAGLIGTAVLLDQYDLSPLVGVPLLVGIVLALAGNIIVSTGFMILAPNQAGVLVLFGRYIGTVKTNGFWWVNPFASKRKVSLRAHNLNSDKLKVNDRAGNPIEIAAVVVWRVRDTFAACFDVESYVDYVNIQSESALRHLASAYPYDSWEEGTDNVVSLRGNIDEVSEALERELEERLDKAGVEVMEARLSHLAYAPEIAGAMLQRQQAAAIIAARQKIVEGAVGMVQMALDKLSHDQIVDLDPERRAAMVSNLLVVLCGEREPRPVINAGTLY